MVSAETPIDTPLDAPFERVTIGTGERSRAFAKHLLSLVMPANALAFVFTGPHAWYVAPLFILPMICTLIVDNGPRVERRQPEPGTVAWPYDLLVYVLAAMQLTAVYGVARMFATQSIFSIDMLMTIVVVGGSSGFSIITAHELIHRKKRWEQYLGRLLLSTVLQEHFYTEHLRGHHARVGLPEDPATARFGETYEAFYRRTVPAQFRSAWRLEKRRLGDADMSNLDPRMLGNRIVQGLVVGWALAAVVYVTFGVAALVAFLLQAFMASRLLEAVNYFEHWGLTRRGSRVRPRDSWDTHSWFTYYGLVGLSRHADHHYEQTRPYQELRVYDDVPMLPFGYVGMVDLVMGKNDEYRQLATEELRRKGLGPFEDPSFEPEKEPTQRPSGLRARWLGLSPGLRGLIAWPVILVALTFGGLAERGLAHVTLAEMASAFSANVLIFLAFAAVLRLRAWLERDGTPVGWTWALALSVLVTLGLTLEALGRVVG